MEQSTHLAGQKIRAWREARKLSAEQLGERLCAESPRPVPPHTIYNWEVRGKVARRQHQRKLAELGICDAADWLQPAQAA
jgi:NAD+ synthase (glutamine-hydrolysing)